MNKTEAKLVAEFKGLWTKTHAMISRMQKIMVELRDDHGWSQRDIVRETGVPRTTVQRWLKAYDEGLKAGVAHMGHLTPPSDRENSDRAVARRVITQEPLEVIERIVGDLSVPEAAKLAQAALGKPGIADEMLKNPDQSHAVGLVSAQVHQQMEERSKARRSRDRSAGGISGVAANVSFLVDVIGNLHKAKRSLAESYEEAATYILSDLETEAVEEGLAEIELIIDWYRSYLQSGDQSFEKELERLLGGDGS
jgi:hypothetical protein